VGDIGEVVGWADKRAPVVYRDPDGVGKLDALLVVLLDSRYVVGRPEEVVGRWLGSLARVGRRMIDSHENLLRCLSSPLTQKPERAWGPG
jgi:hypothetical protein